MTVPSKQRLQGASRGSSKIGSTGVSSQGSRASSRSASPGGFRRLDIRTRYSSGDDDLLADFYVPVLSRAVRYERMAGYFVSSSFLSVASGMARFIANNGAIRLLVGAKLTEADQQALLGKVPLEEVLADRLALHQLTADDVARRRLQVIAWLVRQQRLTIRVGLPCDDHGTPLAGDQSHLKYFHLKSGILTDARGDRLAFDGSINESETGWRHNYESFSVFPSWQADTWSNYGQGIADQFERLWRGDDTPGWLVLPLPDAARARLIALLPDDDAWAPTSLDPLEPHPAPELSEADRESIAAIRDAPASRTGVGLASSGIEAWPHQLAIARHVCDAWPRSYLLADEVGLGKTIEAGLVLRELLLSERIASALILVPASLLIQWQEELAEKFLLDVPRLEGRRLCWAGGAEQVLGRGRNRWRSAPLLLASSHLARMRSNRDELLDGPGWDLVFVDETHHARRRGSKPTGKPNEMLATLIALREQHMFEALLLASATPMQLNTCDLWDLLNLFGLPPVWDTGAADMERYYKTLQEPFEDREWRLLQKMLAGHLNDVPPDPDVVSQLEADAGWVEAERIVEFHNRGMFRPGDVPVRTRQFWDDWLRVNTPVRDRVFRTTRATLRRYAKTGVLDPDTVIPRRRIDDCFYELGAARSVYNRLEEYILGYYDAYRAVGGKSAPLGFIMTVYRRRLTSSFHAIGESLKRRRAALSRRHSRLRQSGRVEFWGELDPTDDRTAEFDLSVLVDEDDRYAAESLDGFAAFETGLDDPAALDRVLAGRDLQAELNELDTLIAELSEQQPDEPKMAALYDLLRRNFESGAHDTAVVFTQYRDTLRYIRRQLLSTYRGVLACYYAGRGECWNGSEWVRVSKEQVKERFRRGEVRILLGTDSMSEGLNLQTCGWLVNFDLPWNFTRVEQRIGRVARIGGRPEVQVSNFFYRGTVEEDVYRRICSSHDWFSNVIGNAAPVLAATENVIAEAAMRRRTTEQAASYLSALFDRFERAPVRLEDLDSVPRFTHELQPEMTLAELRDRLLSIPSALERLTEDADRLGVWRLTLDTDRHDVTFDPSLYQELPGLQLLTWGSPLLDELLETLCSSASV